MAIVNYTGNAQWATQVDTLVLSGAPAVNDTLTITCNGKTIIVTATTTVLADLIALLQAAWNSNLSATEPVQEMAEVTMVTVSGTTMTFTHTVPGVTFTFNYSRSTTGTLAISSSTTTTSASGPEDVANVKNYDIGALPSNNDTLVIPAGKSLKYGLTALAALTLGYRIFTDEPIGLPVIREASGNNGGGYFEYRTRALQIKNGASLETLIQCSSSRIILDGLAVQCTLRINATGTSNDSSPVVQFTNGANTTVINAAGGSFAVSYNSGETATPASINISYTSQQESDVTAVLGFGCTTTLLNMVGGTVNAYKPPTTTNLYGGTLNVISGTPTTINNFGGTVNYQGGNCTTYVAYRNTINNFFAGPSAKTFTNTTIYAPLEWQDPMGTITYTNPISIPGGTPTEVEGTFGPGRSLAFAA